MRRITKPVNFKHEFASIIARDQRQWDRSKTVGASEVFRCLLRAYFSKIEPETAGVPESVDDIEWGFSERGNEIERKFAVPKLKEMFGEENCFLMGEEQETIIDGNLSATPDGMIVDLPNFALQNYGVDICSSEVAPEIKSFDPRVNLSKGPKPFWVGQNIVQQGCYRAKTNYRPNNGIILAINCSDYKDIRPYATTFDQIIYDRAHERANRVFAKGAKPEDFEPEGQLTGECKHCPHFERCNEVQMSRFPGQIVNSSTVAPEKLAQIESLTRAVYSKRVAVKAMEDEKKAEEAKLKALLFEIQSTRMGGDGWSVSLSKCKGRESLDKESLIEAGIDPDNYMKEGMPYYRLTPTVK